MVQGGVTVILMEGLILKCFSISLKAQATIPPKIPTTTELSLLRYFKFTSLFLLHEFLSMYH